MRHQKALVMIQIKEPAHQSQLIPALAPAHQSRNAAEGTSALPSLRQSANFWNQIKLMLPVQSSPKK